VLVKKSGGPFDQPSVLTNEIRPKHKKGIVRKVVRSNFSNFGNRDCGLVIHVRGIKEVNTARDAAACTGSFKRYLAVAWVQESKRKSRVQLRRAECAQRREGKKSRGICVNVKDAVQTRRAVRIQRNDVKGVGIAGKAGGNWYAEQNARRRCGTQFDCVIQSSLL